MLIAKHTSNCHVSILAPTLWTVALNPRCRPHVAPPQYGFTALHHMASLGYLDLLDKALDMGADIDAKDDLVRSRPLTLP
jgi:hypothetical protein